jgi:hypothetical protein
MMQISYSFSFSNPFLIEWQQQLEFNKTGEHISFEDNSRNIPLRISSREERLFAFKDGGVILNLERGWKL